MVKEGGKVDPVNGKQDLQCICNLPFSIGMSLGCLIATVTTANGTSYQSFGFSMVTYIIMTVMFFFLSNEICYPENIIEQNLT